MAKMFGSSGSREEELLIISLMAVMISLVLWGRNNPAIKQRLSPKEKELFPFRLFLIVGLFLVVMQMSFILCFNRPTPFCDSLKAYQFWLTFFALCTAGVWLLTVLARKPENSNGNTDPQQSK